MKPAQMSTPTTMLTFHLETASGKSNGSVAVLEWRVEGERSGCDSGTMPAVVSATGTHMSAMAHRQDSIEVVRMMRALSLEQSDERCVGVFTVAVVGVKERVVERLGKFA